MPVDTRDALAQDGWNEIERWHEIKDKLDAVLKLAPEQRPAYLDQVSTADPELCRELESLIASHEQAGTDFLNVPPPQAAADPSAPNNLNPDHREPMIGRSLGTYEIVEQIGAGGMGEVYRAIRADDQYRKDEPAIADWVHTCIRAVFPGQGQYHVGASCDQAGARRPELRFRHPPLQE